MLKKGTKLNSILTGTCPKCQEESMYQDSNPLHFSKLLKMNEKCSNCNTRYMIEPSFFYGAMYVSYALNVALMVATFIISKVLLNINLINTFIAVIVVLILLFPLVTRLARNIYINMFISYDIKFKKK